LRSSFWLGPLFLPLPSLIIVVIMVIITIAKF